MTNHKRGFTLIELLVVIAIIGILSSVVLASLNSAREKSRDARRISDVKQFQLALELYFDSNRGYPSTTQGLAALESAGFIATIPIPPPGTSQTAYAYGSDGTAAGDDGTDFRVMAQLEDTTHSVLASGESTSAYGVSCDTTAGQYCIAP